MDCKRLKCEEAANTPIPWMKKYELDTIDEVAINEEAVSQLLKLSENAEHPPKLILVGHKYGGMGIALVTFARAMLSNNFATAFLQLSPSNREITALFEKLDQFINTHVELPNGKFRIVAVHAFDTMKEEDQHTFWRVVQVHSQTTGFILLASNSTNIIPLIKDEFNLIHFGNENYLLKKLQDVCAAEKITFAEKGLRGILEKVDGNFTQAVNALQDIVNGKASSMSLVLKENPMDNDLIISHILSFLKLKDVKTCRLINSQWNGNSCRVLQRISPPIKLRRLSELKRKMILSLFESESPFPFAKKLEIETAFLEAVHKKGNLVRFFNAASPKLMDLTVSLEHSSTASFDISYPEGLTYPNLKSFCVSLIDCDEERFRHYELVRGIFQNSPKLVEISICINGMSSTSVLQPVLNLAKDKQVANRQISLNLYTESITSDQHDLIIKAGLMIKTSQVTVSEDVAVSVKRFLESQSESLEYLHIQDDYEYESLYGQFELPRMARLSKLKLTFSGGISDINQPIEYGEQFPVLEHLTFEISLNQRGLDSFLHPGRSKIDVGHKLKTLNLNTDVKASPQNIENAAILFPNLTKLEISASLEILKKVYTGMRKLEELVFSYHHPSQAKNLEIDYLLMGVERTRKGCSWKDFKPDESLLALTELKTLRIISRQNNIIGETVCRSVFMKMKSLKLIDFFGEYQAKMGSVSGTLLKEMREKILLL